MSSAINPASSTLPATTINPVGSSSSGIVQTALSAMATNERERPPSAALSATTLSALSDTAERVSGFAATLAALNNERAKYEKELLDIAIANTPIFELASPRFDNIENADPIKFTYLPESKEAAKLADDLFTAVEKSPYISPELMTRWLYHAVYNNREDQFKKILWHPCFESISKKDIVTVLIYAMTQSYYNIISCFGTGSGAYSEENCGAVQLFDLDSEPGSPRFISFLHESSYHNVMFVGEIAHHISWHNPSLWGAPKEVSKKWEIVNSSYELNPSRVKINFHSAFPTAAERTFKSIEELNPQLTAIDLGRDSIAYSVACESQHNFAITYVQTDSAKHVIVAKKSFTGSANTRYLKWPTETLDDLKTADFALMDWNTYRISGKNPIAMVVKPTEKTNVKADENFVLWQESLTPQLLKKWLFHAVYNNREDQFQKILEHREFSKIPEKDLATALIYALLNGHDKLLERYVASQHFIREGHRYQIQISSVEPESAALPTNTHKAISCLHVDRAQVHKNIGLVAYSLQIASAADTEDAVIDTRDVLNVSNLANRSRPESVAKEFVESLTIGNPFKPITSRDSSVQNEPVFVYPSDKDLQASYLVASGYFIVFVKTAEKINIILAADHFQSSSVKIYDKR